MRENIKSLHYWPFVLETTGNWSFPREKGQKYGKYIVTCTIIIMFKGHMIFNLSLSFFVVFIWIFRKKEAIGNKFKYLVPFY